MSFTLNAVNVKLSFIKRSFNELLRFTFVLMYRELWTYNISIQEDRSIHTEDYFPHDVFLDFSILFHTQVRRNMDQNWIRIKRTVRKRIEHLYELNNWLQIFYLPKSTTLDGISSITISYAVTVANIMWWLVKGKRKQCVLHCYRVTLFRNLQSAWSW